MTNIIEFVKALSGIAWPLIAAVLLWKLFPSLRSVVASRNFNVKIAGMEVSVQDATEQIRAQIEDLQKQVIALRSAPAEIRSEKPDKIESKPEQAAVSSKRLLWVDDNPQNNAFEIAQLASNGIEVVRAASTSEATALLSRDAHFSAIISDMGRAEGGVYVPRAGLELLRTIRGMKIKISYFVYTSTRNLAANDRDIKAAGGDGATDSTVRLLEWAGEVLSKH